MLRTPDGFLKEGSKVFRPTPADKRIIRALLQAAQTKAKDVELDVVSLDTRVEAAYDAVFDCCLAVLNAERYRTHAVPGLPAMAAGVMARKSMDRIAGARPNCMKISLT